MIRITEEVKKDINIILIKNKKENLDKNIMITLECHILGIILTMFLQCNSHFPLHLNNNNHLHFLSKLSVVQQQNVLLVVPISIPMLVPVSTSIFLCICAHLKECLILYLPLDIQYLLRLCITMLVINILI